MEHPQNALMICMYLEMTWLEVLQDENNDESVQRKPYDEIEKN